MTIENAVFDGGVQEPPQTPPPDGAQADVADVSARAMTAHYVLEYTYRRSVGPIVGRFLTGLKEGRIEGIRTRSGKVLVPPTEYDPETGDALSEFVPVADVGVVTTWSWIAEPRRGQPLDRAFAWALVVLDGADTGMLHAVDAGSIDNMKTGMRVKVRWRPERTGLITDIACFEPLHDGGAETPPDPPAHTAEAT